MARGERQIDGGPTHRKGKGRPVTTAERKEMARLRMAGASRDEICKATGRCAEAVSAALKHPETVALLKRLADELDEELAANYRAAVRSVAVDLQPGAEYQARIDARRQAREMVKEADQIRGLAQEQAAPRAAEGQGQAQYTLTELLSVMRRVEVKQQGAEEANG